MFWTVTLGFFRGTISNTKVISGDWTWQFNTLGNSCELAQLQRAGSAPSSLLKHIALAQGHRASSMASSWLNFFNEKKKRKKKTPKKLSQLRHVELADECESIKRILTMYWPGSWRIGEPAQGHVAGSISGEVFSFFSQKKLSQLRGAEPATRRWASYVALSQLRGTEPATWHWASKVALSFELARRQWASKVALSFIIYIYLCNPKHIIY